MILSVFIISTILSWTTVNTSEDNKYMLRGVFLRASAYNYPPVFIIQRDKNGSFTYDGLVPEFLYLLESYFEMKFSFIHVDPLKVLEHGVEATAITQFSNGEIDMVSVLMERTVISRQKMDLLYPLYIGNFLLLQPWPEEESRLKTPIRPFTLPVWLSIGGSTLLFVLLTTLVILYYQSNRTEEHAFWKIFFFQLEFVIAVVTTQQGSYRRGVSSLPVCLMTGFWLLAMIVLVYAYAGVLTSVLAVPKLEPTMETLEQVIERNQSQITIERNSVLTKQFMEATSGTYKKIGESLRQHPELLFGDILHGLDNVLHHHCIYPTVEEMVRYFIRTDLRGNGKCRMTSSLQKLSHFMSFHMGIGKASPYTDVLNGVFFMYFWDHGITNYIMRNYLPGTMHCRADAKSQGRAEPFKLVDFTSSFFLLGIGLSLSTLGFILELFISKNSISKEN